MEIYISAFMIFYRPNTKLPRSAATGDCRVRLSICCAERKVRMEYIIETKTGEKKKFSSTPDEIYKNRCAMESGRNGVLQSIVYFRDDESMGIAAGCGIPDCWNCGRNCRYFTAPESYFNTVE